MASTEGTSSSTSRICMPASFLDRELEGERRSLPGSALDFDPSSVGGHDLSGDPQAESEPSIRALRHPALESLEDPLPVRLRDARPAIADANARRPSIFLDADVDRAAATE